MATDPLTEAIQLRYPRLLVSGVDYNDAQQVLRRITRLDDWCPEWERMAAVLEHPENLRGILGEGTASSNRPQSPGNRQEKAGSLQASGLDPGIH